MTELVPSSYKYSFLDPEQRSHFKALIVPEAHDARIASQTVIRFAQLDEERKAADELMVGSTVDERDYLESCLQEIMFEKARMGGDLGRQSARELFRGKVNSIRVKVDALKNSHRIELGEIHPLAVSLSTRPQIPPALNHLSLREYSSPPMIHHGLGTLPIHRDGNLPDDIKVSLSFEASRRWPKDPNAMGISLALTNFLPEKVIARNINKRPSATRRASEISRGIADVVGLIFDYTEGSLSFPRAEQVGLESREQDKYIESAIRIILLHELYEELRNPQVNENQFRTRIVNNVSKAINQLAELIGPQGYEKVASAIESLTDIEATLLRSRLSISEDINLGFPRSDLAHEKRFVEMLIWSVYAPKNRGDKNSERRAFHVNLILEKLVDRVDVGDLDSEEFLHHIQIKQYGEELLYQIFEASTDENRVLILDLLNNNDIFSKLRRNLRKMIGEIDNVDLESLLDSMDEEIGLEF